MAHEHVIEVGSKAGVVDPVGKGLAHDIQHLGLARTKGVSSSQLYKIEGELSADERNRIAKDLLADPILNVYHAGAWDASSRSGALSKERGMVIDVWYKQGVTDVVGDSVLKGIRDLNIEGVKEVRTGMRYHLRGVTRREIAEKIALALLVNPLVHDSIIHAD